MKILIKIKKKYMKNSKKLNQNLSDIFWNFEFFIISIFHFWELSVF